MPGKIARGAAFLLVCGLIAVLIWFWRSPYHRIGVLTATGVTAKQVCSLAFISGIEPDQARALYLTPQLDWAADLVDAELDRGAKTATSSVWGLYRQTAQYRDGLGCTLNRDQSVDPGGRKTVPVADRPLPVAEPGQYDLAAIDAALDRAFSEPRRSNRNTLAVVVLHRGEVVAERYAPFVGANTPLLGWSMAKSMTATLAGAMAWRGEVSLQAPNAVASPANPDITLDHLLRMTSGLAIDEWNDGTDPNSEMLFVTDDIAKFAASRAQRSPPGTRYRYMSGSTILAMRHLQDRLGDDLWSQIAGIHERLFAPLGMKSVIIEPDAAGNLFGSSYMWASARDWARLGQLYLDNGRVGESVLFAPDWIDYVTTLTPDSDSYGSGFWLYRRSEALPDVFEMDGFQGQNVVIVPRHELVIVRLGATNRQRSGISQLTEDMIEVALDHQGP